MNIGTLAGAVFGFGAYLIFWFWHERRPSLVKRVEPYLRVPVVEENRFTPSQSSNFLTALFQLGAPWYNDAVRWLGRFTSQNKALRERLKRAGSNLNPTEFRSQQVLAGAAALALALVVIIPMFVSGRLSPLLALIVVILFPITAALMRDWFLGQAISRRETALARQLPTITELLALAVGAGEAPLAALERVASCTRGELSDELRRTISDIHAGTPMDQALKNFAQRSQVTSIVRFADSVAVAIERGTPLADVLHDQARDSREESRRQLMELSGRKEIAMLVPVIFFILPITVVFAVFPGLSVLRGGL